MEIAHLQEGWRIYRRSSRVHQKGLHRYCGDAASICSQIVDDCFNGVYFQTSTNYGHFCEFYMRDFGWAVKSLMELGHSERVLKTLEYALERFSAQRLTTTINPKGKCIDIFEYSPDSAAYLLYSLKTAGAEGLVKRHRVFLEKEILKCFNLCFDPPSSLIRKDRHFGSIKDSTFRYSSTYDNTMIAMLAGDADVLGLKNPFRDYDIKAAMMEKLWHKDKGYWYDDLQKYDAVTGDNNTFPYWTGVFEDVAMKKSSVENIRAAGLDEPFPLKYSVEKFGQESLWRKLTVPEYQTHSIKTHMGGLFIHVVKGYEPVLAADYKKRYGALIEEHGTYLENYDKDGNPLGSRFYYSDEGNVWAANYLTL